MKPKTHWTDSIVTELERELGVCAEAVPKGFRTKDEWAKIWNCHETTAWKLCRTHAAKGRMESGRFRIATSRRRNRPVVHYRAVKQ